MVPTSLPYDGYAGRWRDLSDVLLFGGQHRSPDINALDNFHAREFELSGKAYATVEHAFQSLKYADTDAAYAERVRLAATPMEAKELGRQGQLPRAALDRWRDGGGERAMRDILRAKFALPDLRAILLGTGERPLAEQVDDDPCAHPRRHDRQALERTRRTWDDRRWGIGRNDGGANLLGKLLMRVRDELRQAPAP